MSVRLSIRVHVRLCVWFLVIVSPEQAETLIFVAHKLHDVEDTWQHYMVKGKVKIKYCRVNASRPKPLAVATSTLV